MSIQYLVQQVWDFLDYPIPIPLLENSNLYLNIQGMLTGCLLLSLLGLIIAFSIFIYSCRQSS